MPSCSSFSRPRSDRHSSRLALAALGAVTACWIAAPAARGQDNPQLVAPTEPLSAEEQQKLFRLPPGFEIELDAAEPDIRKPININFDAAGRLFSTESVEYPFPPAAGAVPRDKIKVFTDSNGDGRPDALSTYAEQLVIPIGLCPLPQGVLGYSIPAIYRFEDRDGDGRADERTELYREFGFRDTHGMASSFRYWIDGWVYACHGFANDSEVAGKDAKPIKMNSGNTYRFRPDGSRIEYHTHGQVNPFGLAFDPWGNLYSSDCHTKPVYLLLRGAYYPSFGKPHDGLGYGPEMIEHLHNSTGIAGIVYYAAEQFPPEYRDTIFIGNPVTGRINRDRLEQHGSTYKAVELPDFLSCDDPWFRPVDLQLGPDGALYVADFYNCIIGHYEVSLTHPRRDRERGRIWRIVYRGEKSAPGPVLPNLAGAGDADLVQALADPNLTVRVHATQLLAARALSPETLAALVRALHSPTSDSPYRRAHAVWVLERHGALAAEELRRALDDPQPLVRTHAVKLAAERADWNAPDWLRARIVAALRDDNAFVQRAAADALGRHPDPQQMAPLLECWQSADPADHNLIHTVRMALRDHVAALADPAAAARRFEGNPAQFDRLADVALGARTEPVARFLVEYLAGKTPEGAPRAAARSSEFFYHAARYASRDDQALLQQAALGRKNEPADRQRELLVAVHRAALERREPLAEPLREWGIELVRAGLADRADAGKIQQAAALCRELRLGELAVELESRADDPAVPAEARGPLSEALLALDAPRAARLLEQYAVSPEQPAGLRHRSAELLGGINLPAARERAVRTAAAVPQEVALFLARGMAGSREGAELLLKSLEQGKLPARLLQDAVVAERLRGARPHDAEARVAALLQDLPEEDERLLKLLADRKAAFGKSERDAARGKELFLKHCAACHKIGAEGNKVGPELDGIGIRGLDRILEDTLSPNRNVDEAFRATVIVLNSGLTVTGLLLRKEGDTLVVVDDQGKERRIPEGEVDEQRQIKLSPMPANVAEQLPAADFHHLMEFLLQQRAPRPPEAAEERK